MKRKNYFVEKIKILLLSEMVTMVINLILCVSSGMVAMLVVVTSSSQIFSNILMASKQIFLISEIRTTSFRRYLEHIIWSFLPVHFWWQMRQGSHPLIRYLFCDTSTSLMREETFCDDSTIVSSLMVRITEDLTPSLLA